MTAPELSHLEDTLGRRLPPAERASITNLNEVPEELIAEMKKLGSASLARRLLDYYCTLACRPYLSDFVEKVVIGNESPKLWRRGDVLVPAPSLKDQLCLKREALLAPIGGYSGVRIIPDRASWASGTSWVGAPAKPRPNADYRSKVPEGAANLLRPKLERAPDAAITVRRWIAARIARCLASSQPKTIDALSAIDQSLPPVDQWSEDARIAVAALLREFQELIPSEGEIPGFRGPDTWYRGADFQ
jgi:hypothetical protein